MFDWQILHLDDMVETIHADSVSMNGPIVVFLKHGKVVTTDGQIQGNPIAFVSLDSVKSVVLIGKTETGKVVELA